MNSIESKVIDFCKTIYFPIKVVRFGKGMFPILHESSYYIELKRKSYFVRLFENLRWLFKFGTPNEFYNLYGLDVKNNSNDYLDNEIFIGELHRINKIRDANSQTCLLRDKFLFYKYLSSFNIPTPDVFAIMKNGLLYNDSMEEIPFSVLEDKCNYFVKELGGECASFVKRINDFEEYLKIKDRLTGSYIFQEALIQSDELNHINPKALNTLRLVTYFDGSTSPRIFSAVLRVGTVYTRNVDNWAAGGLAIGVDSTGVLKKYGFYKPRQKNEKTECHPDTGFLFENYKLTEYDSAVKLAINAHKLLYNIPLIGWDIAFTTNGPVIIEGNDNWEISLMQACNNGLKKEWNSLTKNLQKK